MKNRDAGLNKAVFLDRDGVINELIYHQEAGVIDSPFTIGQFKLLPDVGKAISILNEQGYKVIVVSNQPGIAKGHFDLVMLNKMNSKLAAELESNGAHVDKICYCLHHPEASISEYRVKCYCRKPEPGLIINAAREFNINLAESYMIGDNIADIQAGKKAGCKNIFIGKLKCEMCRMMEEECVKPDHIALNLLKAVNSIVISKEPEETR